MSNTTIPSVEDIDSCNLKQLKVLAKSMHQTITAREDDDARFTALMSRFDKLETTLQARDNTIIALEASLKAQGETTNELSNAIQSLTDRLLITEKQSIIVDQSTRRRQLILSSKIGKFEEAADLRKTVVSLLSATGTAITDADIDTCYVVGKKFRDKMRVAIELRHQHTRDNIIRSRKSLKGKQDPTFGNFYISEGMCPAFAKLDYKCRLLKEKGFIDSTWFYNGRLYIILVEGGKKTPISHMQDLYEMFDTNAIDTLVR